MNPIRHAFTAFLFILASLVFGQTRVIAQNEHPGQSLPDTLSNGDLPSLSLDFYNTSTIVNRNYNYELLNKKRSLNMWAGEVLTIGMLVLVGEVAANSVLAVENNWNLWVDIPCATAVGLASLFPFILWRNNLLRKADAIEISPNMGFVNQEFILNTAMDTDSSNPNNLTFGINIKVNL